MITKYVSVEDKLLQREEGYASQAIRVNSFADLARYLQGARRTGRLLDSGSEIQLSRLAGNGVRTLVRPTAQSVACSK